MSASDSASPLPVCPPALVCPPAGPGGFTPSEPAHEPSNDSQGNAPHPSELSDPLSKDQHHSKDLTSMDRAKDRDSSKGPETKPRALSISDVVGGDAVCTRTVGTGTAGTGSVGPIECAADGSSGAEKTPGKATSGKGGRRGGSNSNGGNSGGGSGGGGARSRLAEGERRYSGRCSPERLSGETSRQERRELSAALAGAIDLRLRSGRAVYLDGLGVLYPEQLDVQRPYVLGNRLAVRKETIVRPAFERAGEFSPFIREKYTPVEISDLLETIYVELPLALQLTWSTTQVRFYLSGLVALLKREIILDGFSHRLTPLASFFALHNRHGDSDVDWFAGADIFVRSSMEQLVRVSQPRLLERAAFRDAEEFGTTVLGKCKHRFPLNVLQAIRELGLTPSRAYFPDIDVLIFERAPGRLAFMTVGARHIQRADQSPLGVEFLLDAELDGLTTWPFTLLAASIDQVCARGALSAVPGAHEAVALAPAAFGSLVGNSLADALVESSTSGDVSSCRSDALSWSGVLLTQSQMQDRMLLEDGNDVGLVWLTPIRGEELGVAERRTADHLAALLSRKGALQSAKLQRTSVLFRTQVL